MSEPTLPDLSGHTVLVTGASGTVGSGIARRFAQAGAAVVAHYHAGEQRAAALVSDIRKAGGRATALGADLTDESECRRLVRAAAGWTGRLTGLVNNAGVQPVQPLDGMTVEDWRRVMDANVLATFACTQAAVQEMRATGGTITHITSIEGSNPAAGHAHYCASKAALIMHARSASLEYGPLGLRVNTVSPGLIDRPGLAEDWPEGVARWAAAAPLGRRGRPQDVGDACVFLASGMAAWVTGHDLVVDGGVSARPTW